MYEEAEGGSSSTMSGEIKLNVVEALYGQPPDMVVVGTCCVAAGPNVRIYRHVSFEFERTGLKQLRPPSVEDLLWQAFREIIHRAGPARIDVFHAAELIPNSLNRRAKDTGFGHGEGHGRRCVLIEGHICPVV